jgi:hypothetical protein
MLNDKDTTQHVVLTTAPRPIHAWLQFRTIDLNEKYMHARHQIEANAFSAISLPS